MDKAKTRDEEDLQILENLAEQSERATICPKPNNTAEAIKRVVARVAALEEALRGVVRVADRKTNEFDAARAALGVSKG